MLDARGRFWNAGVPIDHDSMAVAFASWIRKHPDDGRFILTNGYDWTYFKVEDAPFFVKHVEALDGGARLRLFDDTEESLTPGTVSVSDAGVLYTRVKPAGFEARFHPTAQAEMVEFVAEGPDGTPCIELAGRQFPIRARLQRSA